VCVLDVLVVVVMAVLVMVGVEMPLSANTD
jgi:hypothetical protein